MRFEKYYVFVNFFQIVKIFIKKGCRDYDNGFCKLGMECQQLHIKSQLCPDYFYGFCPLGPNCSMGHPKLLGEKDNEFLRFWNRNQAMYR